MHIISLIAPAGQLDGTLVASLQGAFGAIGDALWLSPDEAAEFPVRRVPENLAKIQNTLTAMQVDVNCLPDKNRKKYVLVADMDSTMIGQECIDELAAEAGVGKKVAEITAKAMNGELEFDAALRERVGLLKDLPVGVIDDVIENRITLADGGRTLVATMKANGGYAALVSGGFLQFTEKLGGTLGFDETRANRLIEKDGKLTGEVGKPILGRQAKVNALRQIVEKRGLTLNDAIAVGDGANDLGMIKEAGTGVALHAKPSVAKSAPVRIDNGDLTALLFLQGYSIADFVAPN